MKELDLMVLWAVFLEMMGPALLISLIAITVLGTIFFVILLFKERGIVSRRFVLCQFIGLIGGVLALVVMTELSHSGFRDAGGPIDWILIALVYGSGFVIVTLSTYSLFGWFVRLRGSCR